MMTSQTALLRSVAIRALVAGLALVASLPGIAAEAQVEFRAVPGAIKILAAGQPVATYYYSDPEISRPFYAHVHAPGGVPVTRTHPPDPARDDTDHGTPGNYFHPGIWLAFSDINGHDYWRLKAPVRHQQLLESPQVTGNQGVFTVENHYLSGDDARRLVCREHCRHTLMASADHYLLVVDSLFLASEGPLSFGDQEEMGLGVRVATPMAVKHGGELLDDQNRRGGKEIWGREARWCRYSGAIGDRRVGVLLVPDPANPWPSRMHARDYGLLAANPFGQRVFGDETNQPRRIAAGSTLRLRFALVLHAGNDAAKDRETSSGALFQSAIDQMARLPRPDSE